MEKIDTSKIDMLIEDVGVETVDQLVEMMIIEKDEKLDVIETLLYGDFDSYELKALFHGLKGTMSIVSSNVTHLYMQSLEKLSLDSNTEQLKAELPYLKELLEDITIEFRQYLKNK